MSCTDFTHLNGPVTPFPPAGLFQESVTAPAGASVPPSAPLTRQSKASAAEWVKDSPFTTSVTEWSLVSMSHAVSRIPRRTALGRKLDELRMKALASGLALLSEEEILLEVKSRRGEER
jgi:hypothetical protein